MINIGVILWVVISMVVAYFGKDTRIGFWGIFFCSILFSPLIMIIALLFTSQKTTKISS